MKSAVQSPWRQRNGQALVTVAVTLVALMGIVGLAIDVGWMMVARNELQNGADAAALAVRAHCTSRATGHRPSSIRRPIGPAHATLPPTPSPSTR